MARKPKAAPSNDFAATPEGVMAALGDAPAPVRRGSRPKAAAAPEPLAMVGSDDAAGGTADADDGIADPVAPPVRKRPGPKPEQRAGGDAAALLRKGAGARPGRKARAPDDATASMSAANSKPDTEIAGQQDHQEQPRGPEPAMPEATPDPATNDAATPGSRQNPATSAQPVAQWDRATDTVRFDWAEIERKASQDGSNQAMAKLLVAARAQGANSRWPL